MYRSRTPEIAAEQARSVIERVRVELARLRMSDGQPVRCSIGLVTFDRAPTSLKELVTAGDELIRRAKESGKDRIEQAERRGSFVALGPA